jgi:hypothetical protein
MNEWIIGFACMGAVIGYAIWGVWFDGRLPSFNKKTRESMT